VAILERIGGERRPTIHIGAFGRRMTLERSAPSLDRRVLERARDVATRVADAASRSMHDNGDIGRELARAGRELKLDERIDEIARRIRDELPAGGVSGIAERLEHRLPDTGRGRRDRGDESGRTRGRAVYIGLALLVGAIAGAVAALLLDPARGERRRAEIARRSAEVRREASRRVASVVERARRRAGDQSVDAAVADSSSPSGDQEPQDERSPQMVPVMDPVAVGAEGPAT